VNVSMKWTDKQQSTGDATKETLSLKEVPLPYFYSFVSSCST
jgi:hypothetical protein